MAPKVGRKRRPTVESMDVLRRVIEGKARKRGMSERAYARCMILRLPGPLYLEKGEGHLTADCEEWPLLERWLLEFLVNAAIAEIARYEACNPNDAKLSKQFAIQESKNLIGRMALEAINTKIVREIHNATGVSVRSIFSTLSTMRKAKWNKRKQRKNSVALRRSLTSVFR